MRRPQLFSIVAAGALLGAALGTPAAGASTPAPPPTAVAVSTADGLALLGDAVTRRWRLHPGSGALGATDAGASTVSLVDPVTGAQHVGAPSPDFSLTVDGGTLTSATGWSAVSATTGTTVADPGHGAGPADGSPATVTFTYTRATGPATLTVSREYRLALGDALMEVRTRLRSTGAPAVVTGWTVEQLLTPAPVGPAQVVELHSGSSYTSRHGSTHVEPADFDDQGEVLTQDDAPGAGVVLVDQRRAGPATRATRAAIAGGQQVAVAVEPARELGIVPVQSVTGSDTDNSLPNPAYPVGARVETVAAGGELDLGTAYVGVFHGGDDAAPAVLQRHLAGSVLPSAPVDVQQNTFHPFNDGNGMTGASMLAQARAARALGAGSFVLDDGWQGGAHGLAGDWRLDPAKFPDADGDGHPDVSAQIRATGLRFGVWLEALLFSPSSDVYRAHPDWACAPTGDASAQVPDSNGLGYWDATNTGWQAYLTGVVDRLVADDGVREFKLDNEQWMDCGASTYPQYERAWEGLVASWQARHPDVVFQLDETIDERSFPYAALALGPTWFEDDHVKSVSHPGATRLSQELSDLWQVSPWVPASTLGIPLFHDTVSTTAPDGTAGYQLPFALLGEATFWRDTTTLSPADAAETRWWTGWYAAHRAAYTGLVLRDSTADPIDGLAPVVLQPWDHQTRTGYLTVVRQGGGDPGPQTLTVPVRDVDPAANYALADVRTGEALGNFGGAELAAGVSVVLADRYRTRVIAVAPAAAGSPSALPETPLAVALPLLGITALAVARRRRRRAGG
jgi:hypothetical protein